MQIATLGLRHELLEVGLKDLGLRLSGGQSAVFNELSREVREDQLLVRRAAAQAGALLGSGHFVSYELFASIGRMLWVRWTVRR